MDANTTTTGSGNAKVILGLLALGVVTAAGYYFLVYKPEQLTPEKKFTRVISFIKNEANA